MSHDYLTIKSEIGQHSRILTTFLSIRNLINDQVVLPFPEKEKTFGYTDKDIPILGRFVECLKGSFLTQVLIFVICARFTGDQDIVLKMPPGRKVSDLK